MKTILVPTDFSKHAENALKVAAQIAKKNNGEIILLHMLELSTSGNDALNTSHEIPELMFFKNAAVAKLEELENSDFLNDIKVSSIVQFNMAFEGIIENGKKHYADLVVMGSHGASGFHEMFVGSNAEKVVRNSEIPVLVIKKEDADFKVDTLTFASTYQTCCIFGSVCLIFFKMCLLQMCVRVCVFVSCMDVCVQLHTDSECYGFGGVVDLVAVRIELGKEVERRTQDGGEEKCDLGGEESHCKRDRSCCAQSLLIISSSIFYIRTGVNCQRRRMLIPKQSWLLVGECDADCDTELNA